MEVHATGNGAQPQEKPASHSIWRTSILFTLVTAVIFGLAYPLAIAGIARLIFPHQAGGSLILHNGQIIGSSLLAQSFTSDRYFHPRPSVAGNGYDPTSSGGSNLAQTNAKLIARIQGDIDKLEKENPGKPVPIDLVTASASGLDPDALADHPSRSGNGDHRSRSPNEQRDALREPKELLFRIWDGRGTGPSRRSCSCQWRLPSAAPCRRTHVHIPT